MTAAGNRKVIAEKIRVTWDGCADPFVMPIDCISGIMMKIMGTMKMLINSRRLVNALTSLRIMAASTLEKPSFPKSPVFGA